MKKINSIITLMVIMLITNVSLAQTIHNAKVMGIVPIGQKDVAMILDETTQEMYKTSTYDRYLLTIEENIELEIKPNEKAKVRKPNLNANIMAFKEDNPQENNGNNVQSFHGDKYKFVGEQHNLALDYIYNKLVIDVENGLNVSNTEEVLILIQQHTETFVLSNPHTRVYNIDGYRKIINMVVTTASNQDVNTKLYFDEQSNELTNLDKRSLDIMSKLIDRDNFNETVDNINYMNDLLRKPCASSNGRTPNLPIYAAEINLHSIEYWNNSENLQKWLDLSGNTDSPVSSLSWGSLGKADAAGGVAAGIGAAVVNIIPGAGQVGYLGAILGGAAANSAMAFFN